jgi:hypothetical protein
VVLAAGATSLLLLCALGYAMGHPQAGANAALRLAWCLVPLVATVDCAAAVARNDPATRPPPGVFAAGLGPVRLSVISALTTAFTCLLGSALALLCFLQLRGDLPGGLPASGAADGLLAAGRPLPVAALLVLLAVVPLVACVTCALMLRPRRTPPEAHPGDDVDGPPAPAPRPGGLPWGVALFALGLTVEAYTGPADRKKDGLPLPSGLADGSAGVLAGWALTALGLAIAGPALTFACGRLLQTRRPSGLRLLAGRILQQEARRIGRPLGVVCAVASGSYAAVTLFAQNQPGAGPMTLLGGVTVAGCTVATLLMAAAQARQSRAHTTAALLRLGAPRGLLRTAVALRTGALLALFAPLTWAVAELAALPLEA